MPYSILKIEYLFCPQVWKNARKKMLAFNPDRPIYFYHLASDCRMPCDIYLFW